MDAPSPIDLATGLFGSVLEIGSSTTAGPLTLVALFGSLPGPDYVLAQDLTAKGKLKIMELADRPEVSRILVQNDGLKAALILDADHVEGAKQDRIFATSVLVPATSTVLLPVTCVERGRWSTTSKAFGLSPHTAVTGARMYNKKMVAASLRSGGDHLGDQPAVWSHMEQIHRRATSSSPTGAMRHAYENRSSWMQDTMNAIPNPAPGQTGVMAFWGEGQVAVEAFDRSEALAKVWPRLLSGYVMEVVGLEPAEVKPGTEREVLGMLGRAEATAHAGMGLGTDVVLIAGGLTGGALVWEQGVVHAAAFGAI